jgi:transcription-repair coupling factor (superfamily II helicase)
MLPASEAPLDAHAISRFRSGYVARFGPATSDDPLYEAVSAGRKAQGMEHWLPLFHEHLDTLFDFVPGALILLAHQSEEAKTQRIATTSRSSRRRPISPCRRRRCISPRRNGMRRWTGTRCATCRRSRRRSR